MKTVLITGADGHVGKALARWFIVHSEAKLVLCMRANDEDEQQQKRVAIGTLASNSRCKLVFADLRNDEPFADLRAEDIDAIVHSAAVTSFAVEKDQARGVNVEGTRKVVEFARRCSGLKRFAMISSIYSAGLTAGVIEEKPHQTRPTFANYYEWSKWEAEALVTGSTDLPWQIYRIATIVGEDAGGAVVQQNAIHNTLRLLYYGLLSVVPGEATTRVYTTTTNGVTQAIGKLMVDGANNAVFHLSDSGEEAMTLGEMIDLVYECFNQDKRFSGMRILKPLFCDQSTFDTLANAVSQFSGPLNQSLGSVAPFAPQLFCDKHIDTKNTAGLATLVEAKDLMRAVASYLVQTRWGLKAADAAVTT